MRWTRSARLRGWTWGAWNVPAEKAEGVPRWWRVSGRGSSLHRHQTLSLREISKFREFPEFGCPPNNGAGAAGSHTETLVPTKFGVGGFRVSMLSTMLRSKPAFTSEKRVLLWSMGRVCHLAKKGECGTPAHHALGKDPPFLRGISSSPAGGPPAHVRLLVLTVNPPSPPGGVHSMANRRRLRFVPAIRAHTIHGGSRKCVKTRLSYRLFEALILRRVLRQLWRFKTPCFALALQGSKNQPF